VAPDSQQPVVRGSPRGLSTRLPHAIAAASVDPMLTSLSSKNLVVVE